jgi:hypothetical protein
MALVLSACAAPAQQPAASSLAASSLAASTTPAAVSVPPSQAAADYPYTLPWPEDELIGGWRYATVAWDGEARINHGNQYTDSARTSDGDLFAFGYPTSGTAAELQTRIAQQAAEWHGCDAMASDEQPLAGGGEEGILAVHDCGGRTVIRWYAVHEGFGLIVALIVGTGADLAAARTHFEDRIAALIWERSVSRQ